MLLKLVICISGWCIVGCEAMAILNASRLRVSELFKWVMVAQCKFGHHIEECESQVFRAMTRILRFWLYTTVNQAG